MKLDLNPALKTSFKEFLSADFFDFLPHMNSVKNYNNLSMMSI